MDKEFPFNSSKKKASQLFLNKTHDSHLSNKFPVEELPDFKSSSPESERKSSPYSRHLMRSADHMPTSEYSTHSVDLFGTKKKQSGKNNNNNNNHHEENFNNVGYYPERTLLRHRGTKPDFLTSSDSDILSKKGSQKENFDDILLLSSFQTARTSQSSEDLRHLLFHNNTNKKQQMLRNSSKAQIDFSSQAGQLLFRRRSCLLAGLWLVLAGIAFFGLVLFMSGFFPQKPPLPGHSSWDDALGEVHNEVRGAPSSKFERVVIMVVDALRADFVMPEKALLGKQQIPKGLPRHLEYVTSQLEAKHAMAFVASAQAPTVTLPRIKALTSGSVPSFMDFLANFDSPELKDDNLISQLADAQRRIVFYGDDTWLKLFPSQFFRHDGTTSFFVKDIYEVDDNVTRHIDEELRNPDWDMMILHYLGLDHIGHGEGPFSSLMKPKQQEMDSIIQRINTRLAALDAQSGRHSLFVVLSDHGMNEIGNHGGSSQSETSAFLMMMSSAFKKPDLFTVGKAISQIDLVPTLSLLLGVPIPKSSLGKIIPETFVQFSTEELLRAYEINAVQQLEILKATPQFWADGRPLTEDVSYLFKAYETAKKLGELSLKNNASAEQVEQAIQNYEIFLKGLQEIFATALTAYDMYLIATGIGLLLIDGVAFLLVTLSFDQLLERGLTKHFRAKALNVILFFTIPLFAAHQVACTLYCPLSGICTSSFGLVGFVLFSFSFAALTILVSLHVADLHLHFARGPGNVLEPLLLFAGLPIYVISFFSSSLVEEEHQIWYFLTMSLFLIFALHEIERMAHRKAAGNLSSFRVLCFLGLLLLAGRAVRMWNQTGDKWRTSWDITDWLKTEENAIVLNSLAIISSSTVVYFGVVWAQYRQKHLGNHITRLFQLACVICGLLVIIYKLDSDSPYAVFLAKGVYTFLLLMSALSLLSPWVVPLKHSMEIPAMMFVINFTFLFLLLHKIENQFLFILFGIQAKCLKEVLLQHAHHHNQKHGIWFFVTICHFLGQASFFALGNSNSLATIDISGAYTGLESYNEFAVGFLVIISVFSGPLFWYLVCIFLIARISKSTINLKGKELSGVLGSELLQSMERSSIFSSFLSTFLFIFPTALFCIALTHFRYHLFVWTVFSPKFIYLLLWNGFEMARSLLFIITTVIYCVLSLGRSDQISDRISLENV